MPILMEGSVAGWNEGERAVATHCSYCALQCALKLTVDLNSNKVVKVRGRRDFPTSRGLSCIKGQTAHLQLDHPQRLTTPLLRVDGEYKPIPWDQALDHAARRMREVQAAHGRDAMAVYGSGALGNETVYLLGKFARVALRTANIDYNGRYCMSSAAAAQNAVLGLDRGLHFPLSDLEHSRCIVLAGANIAECLPPIAVFVRHAKRRGCKVIVLEPRVNQTSKLADLHLKARPGSDLAIALALLHEVQARGAVDEAYLASRCSGAKEALEAVRDCDAAWAESLSGVPAEDIRRAAEWLATCTPSVILTGRGVEQHAKGPETVMAFLQVALALGQVGLASGGFGTLTGQGNGQGGREQGQKADQLPGYRSIENDLDRQAVAEVWGIAPGELPGKGLSAQELFQARNADKVRGMWIMASNPAISAAKTSESVSTLKGLDFLMVSDLFFSETCALAELVLPAAAYAEEEGTMTNIEGRVVLRRAAVAPPGEARPDWKAICGVAGRLGAGRHFKFESVEQAFVELARCTRGGRADYSGMNYTKLERNKGLFWPCPGVGHPGTPRLFTERFQHADGKAHMRPLAWRESSEEPDADYPFRLTTGRLLHHYLSGTQTRRIEELNRAAPKAFVELSAATGERLGLADGSRARVRTRRGELVLDVRLNAGQEDSTLFVPMHFPGDGCSNRLTQDALSPLSKMPEFKTCAAALEAAPGEA
ncbi:MAG TPA: molybdopterin oxidoreductase family protein [bacterium]|jgi:assimilatory nitrate reductase catalytic subunit|nr:molybdopterin oxidoreductase family protein [bacterium]